MIVLLVLICTAQLSPHHVRGIGHLADGFVTGHQHQPPLINVLILDCQSGSWQKSSGVSEPLSGSYCGSSDSALGLAFTCKGFNPRVSCPMGYTSRAAFGADAHYLFTCVKN